MPPDVEIIPFKGTKDKMIFWLRGNLGENHASPILILDSDEQKFIDIAQSQGIESFFPGTKIHFKSDDYIKQYQVFKTKKRPKPKCIALAGTSINTPNPNIKGKGEAYHN